MRANHIVEIFFKALNCLSESFVCSDQILMAHFFCHIGLIVVINVYAGVLYVRLDRFDPEHRVIPTTNIQHGCPITDSVNEISYFQV